MTWHLVGDLVLVIWLFWLTHLRGVDRQQYADALTKLRQELAVPPLKLDRAALRAALERRIRGRAQRKAQEPA